MQVLGGRISLAELERHDPAPARGPERRFLCPFPRCADKQNPHRHRSLVVNVETGAYYCHRCRGRGVLQEHATSQPAPRRDGRGRLRRAFALPPPKASSTAPLEHAGEIGVSIAEAPAALAYLERRGIPPDLAVAAGVRFCPSWSGAGGSDRQAGWSALLFPMRDQHGTVLAAHGRAIAGVRKLTRGPTASALFVTPGALEAEAFAVTEGPMDALSLAYCGLPAVAIIGTNAPSWLCKHAFSRRVLVATDADDAGDTAAVTITRQLSSYGATVERLRPCDGCKDWNDILQRFGPEVVRFLLTPPGRPVLQHDPRDDLSEDSALWVDLLSLAYQIAGEGPDSVYSVLHGARCCGVWLERHGEQVRLLPGELGDGYAELRERYLVPHAATLRWLLLRLVAGDAGTDGRSQVQ